MFSVHLTCGRWNQHYSRRYCCPWCWSAAFQHSPHSRPFFFTGYERGRIGVYVRGGRGGGGVGGWGFLPQGARLNHRARLRRMSSYCRHTHCSVLWVHPVGKGRTDSTHSSRVLQCERSGGRESGAKKHTLTHTHHFFETWSIWRDLQRHRSDAGRHGRVFAEGPEQTRGELRAFSGAWTSLWLLMNETMTGRLITLCYRLRSCCWKSSRQKPLTSPKHL